MTLPIPALDAAALGALALCMLVGLRRGRDAELAAVILSLLACFGAAWAAPALAPWVPVGQAGGALNVAAALAFGQVAGLVAGWLLGRIPLLLVRRPGTALGRVLAAAFGALRAWVLGLMAATVVALTPAAQSSLWQDSTLARWLEAGVRGVQPLLPPELVRHLAH